MAWYAGIDSGIVDVVFESSTAPVPTETFVDVTDVSPRPQVGWTHTGGTNFTAPVEKPILRLEAKHPTERHGRTQRDIRDHR